jgi:hypothetical protein
MCVAAIIYQPVSLDDLESMEADNPHGGGVAWANGHGQISFIKGLTARQIFQYQEEGTLAYPYLLHFRWATYGAKVPQLTHPFVIGPRALLGETSGDCQALFIHNGTWPNFEAAAQKYIESTGNYTMPQKALDHASDTAIAAWLAKDNPEILDEVPWATAKAWACPEGKMQITLRGDWTKHNNNYYSNLNWQRASTPGVFNMRAMLESTYSWDEYLADKYGRETAREINGWFMGDGDDADLNYPGLGARVELDLDNDLVSEDGEIVNSFLARQMMRGG